MLWNHINGPSGTRTAIFSKSPWSQMSFCEFTIRCIHVPRPTWEWISEWGEREMRDIEEHSESDKIKSNRCRRTTHLVRTFICHISRLATWFQLCLLCLEPRGKNMHFITNRQKVGSAWWRYKVIWLLYVVEVHLYWHAVLKHSCNFLLVFIY